MAIQTVALDLKGIDDAQGYAAVERALGTIGGVTAMRLDPAAHRVLVEYDDTQTSVHAFKAALTRWIISVNHSRLTRLPIQTMTAT